MAEVAVTVGAVTAVVVETMVAGETMAVVVEEMEVVEAIAAAVDNMEVAERLAVATMAEEKMAARVEAVEGKADWEGQEVTTAADVEVEVAEHSEVTKVEVVATEVVVKEVVGNNRG